MSQVRSSYAQCSNISKYLKLKFLCSKFLRLKVSAVTKYLQLELSVSAKLTHIVAKFLLVKKFLLLRSSYGSMFLLSKFLWLKNSYRFQVPRGPKCYGLPWLQYPHPRSCPINHNLKVESDKN
jgi:hypothetical protein